MESSQPHIPPRWYPQRERKWPDRYTAWDCDSELLFCWTTCFFFVREELWYCIHSYWSYVIIVSWFCCTTRVENIFWHRVFGFEWLVIFWYTFCLSESIDLITWADQPASCSNWWCWHGSFIHRCNGFSMCFLWCTEVPQRVHQLLSQTEHLIYSSMWYSSGDIHHTHSRHRLRPALLSTHPAIQQCPSICLHVWRYPASTRIWQQVKQCHHVSEVLLLYTCNKVIIRTCWRKDIFLGQLCIQTIITHIVFVVVSLYTQHVKHWHYIPWTYIH